MRIIDLKQRIKDLPDDMEIMIYRDFEPEEFVNYEFVVMPIVSAKPKLVKDFNGEVRVQSRPVKDSEAVLVLIIE